MEAATAPPGRSGARRAYEGCAVTARARGERTLGWAPPRGRWLAVEHPEPWGYAALLDSGLPEALVARLRAAVQDLDLRPQLMRRRLGRYDPARRTALLGCCDPRGPWIERIAFAAPADLLELDLERAARSRRPGLGEPVTERLYMTCTHGTRDPCCARYGNPVARAVRRAADERAWQASHLGGCRFAATVACFPHGVYLGHLDADSAPAAIAAYERSELALEHFRGRCGQSQATNAAEALVRIEHGLLGLDELIPEGLRELGETTEVRFATSWGTRIRARVTATDEHPVRPGTCTDDDPSPIPRWRLIAAEEESR